MWLPWVKGTDSINFPSQVVFTEDASQTCRYLIARYYKYDETTQSGCLAVFTKDWFQSFLIKGSKIFHWTANHFSVFCFPWAKVWKNINILVIYHTNLFYVKFLQKCHQLSNFWFELFFYNSGHLQQLHFFLLWAGINPIF